MTKLRNIRSNEVIEVQEVNIDCYMFICTDKSNERVYALYSPSFTKIEDEDYFINCKHEPSFQKYVCSEGYVYSENFILKESLENRLDKNYSLFDRYEAFEYWKERKKNAI